MATEAPIRRSSRRAKKRLFSVGDIVEVNDKTTDRVLKGHLISKVINGVSSLGPRWLVSYEDEGWTEYEAYESSFGEIVGHIRPSSGSPTSTATNLTKNSSAATSGSSGKKSARKRDTVTPDKKDGTSSLNSGNEGGGDGAKKKRKTVSFSATEEASDGSTDASKKAAAASAREERSRRRQAALMEQEAKQAATAPPRSRPRPRARGGRSNNKKKGGKHSASTPSIKDKDVVRVPMLTGTLYLYKGKHRRAEFVRSV